MFRSRRDATPHHGCMRARAVGALAVTLGLWAIAAPDTLRGQEAPAPLAEILITEVMPDPLAADDAQGEWIEIYNGSAQTVDLQGWQIVDPRQAGETHTILTSLPAGPGDFVVLANHFHPALNGGVPVDYQYAGVVLENEDGLALLAPDGSLADTVTWQENHVESGRSLERVGSENPALWQRAWRPWPGSAGDFGSPGTATQPPPTPVPAPPLHISELMADPAAAPDDAGEWVELWNPNPFGVRLAGWALAADDGPAHLLEDVANLEIEPGARLVVARVLDPALNGALPARARVEGLQLANEAGALRLVAPDGNEIDRVEWGPDLARMITPGRSLERLESDVWRTAVSPWPGSAGDWGSPGAPPPDVPPTPTPTPTLPAPTPFPAVWPLAPEPSPLQIDEVAYRGDGGEYVVLVNRGAVTLSLEGWLLGDKESGASDEALLALPATTLPPGAAWVAARNGVEFLVRWRVPPDAQIEAGAPGVPVLRAPATGHFSLNDGGDEVVLIAPQGWLADAVRFGVSPAPVTGVDGSLTSSEGEALQRVPGGALPWETDVRLHFMAGVAAPFAPVQMPVAATLAPVALTDGLRAFWGTLDAQSTMSPGGKEPPRLVAARAAALGWDFVALSDPLPPAAASSSAPVFLPAWGWQDDGERAVILGGWSPGLADRWALLPYVEHMGIPVFWQQGPLLPSTLVAAIDASNLTTPHESAALVEVWRAAGQPLLPAGSAGRGVTGLAARDGSAGELLEAVRSRRGWYATQGGLWVTLVAQTGQGTVWMGSTIVPANQLLLRAAAGDAQAGVPLTLWQNGAAVAHSATGTLEYTALAAGNTLFHVTAQRADGAFAVSAPLLVRPEPEGTVLINEVLVDPDHDLNGDGEVNDGDEYVELFNPGALPVSLAGWQLFDLRAAQEDLRRFTLRAEHVIPGRGHLLLWRGETRIVLNNEDDNLYLMRPGGGEADQVVWDDLTIPSLAVARVPDGGPWRLDVTPSPGRANDGAPLAAAWAPAEEGPGPSEGPAAQGAIDVAAGRAPVALVSPPASLAYAGEEIALARTVGLSVEVTIAGVVVLPPGLIHSTIYVAQSGKANAESGAGMRVYLRRGDFPALAPGDAVRVRGLLHSFRGEKELLLESPTQVEVTGVGTLPPPLKVDPAQVGEALEGRLVQVEGTVVTRDGDSLYLAGERGNVVRVVVARSLGWPLPAAQPGQRWRALGVVGQLARAAPWNGGYRVLVRFPGDLVAVEE